MESDKTFKPTVDWMAAKYAEMNNMLFDGQLGECDFGIFTTGRGSQGKVLGWFKMTGRNLCVERYGRRRLYINGFFNTTYIDKDNFVELCKPRIEINGNYSGTEYGFLATLVHEMCHYYTYMHGYCPKQSHGVEFKEIGHYVSHKSNGMFTIQRIASAEQMSQLVLSDEMKAKKEKRLSNRKAIVTAVIAFTPEGKIKLTLTSNDKLINLIRTTSEERGDKVIVTNDSKVIDFLFSKGFKKNMRTWRYWSLEDKPWINELKEMLPETSGEILGVRRPAAQQVPIQQQPKQPKRIFTIKTSNGTFEHDGEEYYSLLKALKERFPRTSEEAIKKLINNPNNYKIIEDKMNTKSILRGVIEEFMANKTQNDDSIEISPNMNLGLKSPFEAE